ncbi:DUF6011 domain-containing protein [Streptomyces sp. NPDC055025]
MTTGTHCQVCGRHLRDPASRARGTGPVCHTKTRPPQPATSPARTDALDHTALAAAGQLTIATEEI